MSDLVLGMFVFMALIMGMGSFISESSNAYSFSAPALAAYNNTTALNSMTSDMASQLQSGQMNVVESSFVILTTAWNAITLPFRMINVMGSTLIQASSDLPGLIPGWVIPIIIGIITVVIVFSIIAAATRSNP